MAKKTKEKEQVKQAWTASDYLEYRKRHVEGAKSYSAPKGETLGQISTRNIVQNAGEGYTSGANNIREAALEEHKKRLATDTTYKAQQRANLSRLSNPNSPEHNNFITNYLIPMGAKAIEEERQENPLLRSNARNSYSMPRVQDGKQNGLTVSKDLVDVVARKGGTEKKEDKLSYLNSANNQIRQGYLNEQNLYELTPEGMLDRTLNIDSQKRAEHVDPYSDERFKVADSALERLKNSVKAREDKNVSFIDAVQGKGNPLVVAEEEARIMKKNGNKVPDAVREYTSMSPFDKQRYNELYGEYGKDRAEEYREAVKNQTHYSMALDDYKESKLLHTPVGRVGARFLGGVETSMEGLENSMPFLFGDMKERPYSVNQYKSSILENAATSEFERGAQNVSSSIGNMLPTAALGSGLQAAGVAAGGSIGSALFGLSTGGNAYKETVNQGYTRGQAQAIGYQQTIDEIVTNELLNGITAYGGGILGKALGKTEVGKAAYEGILRAMSSKIPEGFAKFILDTGLESGSEATQEYLQYYTENIARNMILGEHNDLSLTSPEAWEAAALGALTAGVMNTSGAVVNKALEYDAKKQYDRNMDQYKQSLTPRVEGSNSEQVSDLVSQAVDSTMQDRDIDTSESTPEEAKKQTETLVNAIREESQDVEPEQQELLNDSQDNVSQETIYETEENKNTVSDVPEYNDSASEAQRSNETESKLQKIAEDRIKKSEPAAGVNIEEELDRRSNNRFSDDEEASKFYKAYFEDFQEAAGKDVSPKALMASYDDNMAKAYDTGLRGKSLAELSQDKDFAIFDRLFPGLTDGMWQMGVRKNIENFKGFRAEFRAIFGPQGQSAFDSMVKNKDFADNADAFTRIYNAGRYGKDISMAGDLSKFGPDRSTEIFNAGRQDAEADYEALSKYSERFLKNPKKARKGVFINTSERTPEGARKAVSGFTERTGISVVLVDSRDRASMDSALEQLDKHGLIKEKAIVKKAFNEGSVGTVDPNRAFIVIDINTDNLLNTLGHEITHIAKIYDPEGYKAYSQAVLRKLSETKGYNLEGKIAYIQSEYKKQFGQELSRELAEEEIVAEAADFLNDEEVVKEIVSKNRPFAEKFRDWLKSAAEMIKGIMDTVTSREEAKALRKDYNAYKNAAELWTKMLNKTAENLASSAEMETLIRNQLDLSEGMGSKVKVPGNPMSVEEIFSLDDELMDKSDKYDEATRNAWKNIIEAEDFISLGFPKDDWYYTLTPSARKEYAYQLTHFDKNGPIGDSRYKSGDMNRLYDELVMNTPSEGADVTVVKTADMMEADSKSVRMQIAMSSNDPSKVELEDRKSLIAIHNLDGDKLLKVLKLGGFPMSSIAIVKATDGWEKFGDYSVVFTDKTIDPSIRENKVYGADAYTPTTPPIEYDVNDNIYYEVLDKIDKENLPEYFKYEAKRFNSTQSGRAEQNGMRGVIDAAMENIGMKAAYLSSQGIEVQDQMKEERVPKYDESKIKVYDALINEFGDSLSEISELTTDKQISEYGERFKRAYLKAYKDSRLKGNAQRLVDKFLAGQSSRGAEILRKAAAYQKEGMQYDVVQIRDDAAIRKALDEQIDTKKYEDWLNKMYEGLITGVGIRNNKDTFMPSGNRRSFNQLHYPVTAENIVKAMLENERRGDGGYYGVKSIRAVSTPTFKSIDAIHAAENKLQKMDEKAFSGQISELDNRLNVILKSIAERKGTYFEYVGEVIVDALRDKKINENNIKRELSKYDYIATNEELSKIVDIVNEVNAIPAEMYEAKPERVIPFSEAAYVLVPEDAPKDILEALDKVGLKTVEYNNDAPGSRTEKVNELSQDEATDVRFQAGRIEDYFDDDEIPKNLRGALVGDGVKFYDTEMRDIDDLIRNDIALHKDIYEPGEFITSSARNNYSYNYEGRGDFYEYKVNSISDPDYSEVTDYVKADYERLDSLDGSTETSSRLHIDGGDFRGGRRTAGTSGVYRKNQTNYTGNSEKTESDEETSERDRLAYEGFDTLRTKIELIAPEAKFEYTGSGFSFTDNGFNHYFKTISEAEEYLKKNYKEEIDDLGGWNKIRYQISLDTSGRKLSEGQSDYFANSEVRDDDGRLMVMYHGTPNGNFNVFRNGINFFTPNKEYASWYESPSQSSRTAGKTAEAPRTYEVYLNMTHPFDIRNAEDRKAFIDDYVKGGWALGIDPYVPYKDTTKTGLPSWEEADNIYEWMEENDLLDKYDGIIVDEGGTESGFDRGISYVTFNPNQIKNIDNENPTDSDDIRYQLDIPSDMFYNEDSGDMRTEQANVYLTNMLQASKDHTPSESDIKKVVNEITETYHSKMKKSELTRQLRELYTYMRTNEHVDGAQVSETINAIARQVIREATFTDPQQQDIWDRFRKEMRDTDIYVNPEFVRDIDPDGMASLRKRYFGRVNLTSNPEMSGNDGIRTYIQLQQQFPDIYTTNVDDITSDADAIREILYGFEKARPREESVFGEASTEDEASQALAERIMDAYFEVGNQSVKTQYQKTYKQLREEMKEDIIREYNDGLRAKQIDDAQALSNLNRSRKAGEISEDTYIVRKSALEDYKKQQNEAAHDLFMKKRDKYVDRIQRNKYKDDIIKTSKQLAKMILSPTDKKHIPTEMVEPISKVLQFIDFSSNRVHPDGSLTKRTIEADEFHKSIENIMSVIRRINDSSSVYENNGETSYMVIDPDLMQNLHELSESFANNEEVKDNIDNLSTQNLRTVQQTLRALNQMVNNANRFISMEHYNTVSELAKQSISDFDNSILNRGKLRQKVDDIRKRPIVNFLDKIFTSYTLDAYTYFYTLGNTGMALYEDARSGLDRMIRNTNTAIKFMHETMDRNDVSVKERNKWENDLIEVELRAVPIGGKAATKMKVKLSAAQIMSLYLLNKRGQARMHLYADATTNNVQNGGFIIEPSGRNKLKMDDKHVFKVTEAEADALIAKLTPQQKAVADDIGRFLTEVTSKWGNEVTQKLYGYNKFEAKNYFPIKVDNSTIATTSDSLERAMLLLKNMGQTKSVQQRAYNPITLQNIFDVYCAQAEDMGNYNAFVTSTADLQMWINYKGEEGNVKRALTNAFGQKAAKYFENILVDINTPRKNSSEIDRAIGSLLGLQRGGAIWGNFRVAIQQPFAYIRAAATMDPKYLLQGLTLTPGKKAAEEWELAKKYAPIAQWKDYGFFDIGVGPSMKRVIMGNDTIKDKVSEAGMMPASMGDTIAWVRLWYASQAQVKAEHPDLKVGSEEFYQEAGKIFSHVVDTTQVVDSVLHRSDVMKEKYTAVKNMTAFLSEPIKTYNMLYRAIYDFVTTKGKEHQEKGKILASTVMVWAVAQAVNSAVASLISALRNHDKDKDLLEKYIDKVIPDFIDSMKLWNSIPLVKQILAAIAGGEQDDDSTYELLTLIPAMKAEFDKAIRGESKKGWWGLLYQASQLTTFWGGNNMQNPLRDIDGVIDNLLVGNDMKKYYAYQKAKYNMYAEKMSDSGTISYPNLKQFVATAMKAYANGDKELGDKIVDDLIKRIPEEKVDDLMVKMRPEPGERLLDQSLDAYMKSRFSKFNKLYAEEEKTDESRELKRQILNELIDSKMSEAPEDRKKVYDLVEETGDKNYLPSVLDSKFSNNGEKIELTSSEYQKYQDAYEEYYYKFMGDTIDMNESEEKHLFAQDKAKSAARALAEDMILSERGIKERDTSKIKNYIDTNGDFDAMVDALYEIKDLPSNSQAKKGDIVRNAVSSDSARRALWSIANSNFSEKSYTENVLKSKYQKKK